MTPNPTTYSDPDGHLDRHPDADLDVDFSFRRWQHMGMDAVDLDGTDRTLVALRILALVAWFAHDDDTSSRALAGRIDPSPGETIAMAAERRVRELTDEAMSSTRDVPGYGTNAIITPILIDAGLFDDHQRIVDCEQHMAFDDEVTDLELEQRSQRLRARAAAARELAEQYARRQRENTRACVCGEDKGYHDRIRAIHEGIPSLMSQSRCRFRDIEDVRVRAASRDQLVAAAKSWAVRHLIDETTSANWVDETVETLTVMAETRSTVTVGEALAAAAGSLA